MQSVARPEPNQDFGTEMVREWIPAGDPRAVIVLVHGIAEHSGRYERIGSLLSEAGFHVRAFDLRGWGASGGKRGDIEDWHLYFDQIEGHMTWAAGLGKPLILMGHSMGGTLCAGYAEYREPLPDLLVLSTPAFTGGAPWQRVLARVLGSVAPTVSINQAIKGEELSSDPAVGEAYFSDPLVYTKGTVRLGQALFAAMDEIKDSLTKLDIPVLVIHGGMDTLVPPQSSAFLSDLPGVERRLYPTLRHETMNEPEGPQVVEDIIDWIDSKL